MKISIRDIANRIMLLQILWILFFSLVYSYFPKISVLFYLPDLLNVLLLFCIIEKSKQGMKFENLILLLFILFVGLSVTWGDMNWYYVISNGGRYVSSFLIYYVASEYMTRKYWEKGIHILLVAQGINVFVTGYQNIVMKLHPDFCNGIFGFKAYNNALQGMLCLIISVIAMVYFIDKKWPVSKTLYAIGTSCIVCAFSEIKMYYVLIVLAFVVTFFFRCADPKMRKKIFKFIIIVVFLFWIAYKILEIVFPANLAIFFDVSRYVLYEEYGARGGAGRLSTISYIYNTVFKNDIVKTFFGCGLGSASNDYVYTIGKLFVSFGIMGLSLFLIWLINLCVKNLKKVKNSSENLICIIMLIMIFITMFAWNGLFTQVCFLIFWTLGSYNIDKRLISKTDD